MRLRFTEYRDGFKVLSDNHRDERAGTYFLKSDGWSRDMIEKMCRMVNEIRFGAGRYWSST